MAKNITRLTDPKMLDDLKLEPQSPRLKYTETDMGFNFFGANEKFKDPKNFENVIDKKSPVVVLPVKIASPVEEPVGLDDVSEKEEAVVESSTSESPKQSSKKKAKRVVLSEEKKQPVRREETNDEKRERQKTYYRRLMALVDNRGVKLEKKYFIDSDPDEMQSLFEMHKSIFDKKDSIKMYEKGLLGTVSFAEFINKRYDPLAINLDGWYKSMCCSMDEYTGVFEDLHEKYKSSGGQMEPEVRLMYMVFMSGAMFHMSKEAQKIMPGMFAPTQTGQQPAIFNNLNSMMNNNLNGGQQKEQAHVVKPPTMNVDEQMNLLNRLKNTTQPVQPIPQQPSQFVQHVHQQQIPQNQMQNNQNHTVNQPGYYNNIKPNGFIPPRTGFNQMPPLQNKNNLAPPDLKRETTPVPVKKKTSPKSDSSSGKDLPEFSPTNDSDGLTIKSKSASTNKRGSKKRTLVINTATRKI